MLIENEAEVRAVGPELAAEGGALDQDSRLGRRRFTRSHYGLRLANGRKDREAAFRLRFLVFNLELNEGLDRAYEAGLDSDEFDETCDHLVVEHLPSGRIVGTYRLQTGLVAQSSLGYYSEREFDFSPYESIRSSLVEIGRAAIHRDHRSFEVLTLLWRGIAQYAMGRNARYLIGCSSLTSQSFQEGSDTYLHLHEFLVDAPLRTVPQSRFAFQITAPTPNRHDVRPPKLLRAYLSIGAKLCGPPAIDREFKTIDFLTLLDLDSMSNCARSRFLSI